MKELTRLFGLTLLLASLHLTISAQQPCGSDEHHEWLMKTDNAYKTRHLRYKASLDSLKRAPALHQRQSPVAMTIPVVVHVIHLGEPVGTQTNIPDAQIYDAIAGLNDRYANMNGQGIDIELTFCLANRDPDGCPTSGINRVDGSAIPLYREEGITWADDCGAEEHAVKDLVKWPTRDYYNIWVVHDICGDIAGYAYYPNGDEYDGTVIDIASMNSTGGVLAHELGHGLNLQHTFSGDDGTTCPENNDCLEEGDEVCDTPPHRQNDCGFINFCTTEGDWDNSRLNWMSYCFPGTQQGKFTADQRTRILDALSVEPRMPLLESIACSNEVSMQITSDNSIMCAGEERVLTAVPEGGDFVVANGPGSIEGNVLTATGAGVVEIAYGFVQEGCNSVVYQAISVKPTPASRLKPAEDSLCIGQTTTLQGIPAGGVFTLLSGPGSLDSNVVTATGAGEIELLYEIVLLGCLSKDKHVLISNAIPEAGIEQLTSDVLTAVPDTGVFQWVRCDIGFEAIEGATEAIYSVSSSGSYAVVFIDGNCRDTSECIDLEITSVKNGSIENDIRVYPNPAREYVFVELTKEYQDVAIEIIDLFGRVVITQSHSNEKKIMIQPGLVPGVYSLKVSADGKDGVFRIVME